VHPLDKNQFLDHRLRTPGITLAWTNGRKSPASERLTWRENMLLAMILILLIFGFGYGGYRMGPGLGYYGGGGLSLILTIVLILVLLRAI
jgi:hypothetical protein